MSSKLDPDKLAEKGKKKRQAKEEAYKKHQEEAEIKYKEYQRRSDQKRVFKHITSWFSLRITFLFLFIISLISMLPFIFMMGLINDSSSVDPFAFVQFFSVPVGLTLALFILSIYITIRKVKQEKEWIEKLPFELLCYPDLFVYRSYPTFKVTVEFKRKQPELEYFLNVFGTADLEINNDAQKIGEPDETWSEIIAEIDALKADEEDKEVEFAFEVNNPRASKFNTHRRWARKWIHKAVENQFMAINEKYPIERIIFVNGTQELDFDWTKPRTRYWWL